MGRQKKTRKANEGTGKRTTAGSKTNLRYWYSEELGNVVDELFSEELLIGHGRQTEADNENFVSSDMKCLLTALHPVQCALLEFHIVFPHRLVFQVWGVLSWMVFRTHEEPTQ